MGTCNDTIEEIRNHPSIFATQFRSPIQTTRIDKINNGQADPSKSVPSIGEFFEDEPAPSYSEKISQTN